MHDLLIQIINPLYILFNSARVLSYIPQILAVSKEQNNLSAISLVTWLFWTLANLTTGLYIQLNAPDPLLEAMNYGNAACCAIVVGIVIYKKAKYKNLRPVDIGSRSITGDINNMVKPMVYDHDEELNQKTK
jgi:hypothetical protein